MARHRVSVSAAWIMGGIIIAGIFLLPLVFPHSRVFISDVIVLHPYLAPLVIIIFRFVGMVFAPLPGAPVSLASMALLPWELAFLYNFIGATSGMITAFFIARYYRERAVARFAPLQKIHQWQEYISHRTQFAAFVALRLSTLVVSDFVSYAAGLSKLPFSHFLLAALLVDVPASLLFFYVGGQAIRYAFALLGGFAVLFIMILFIIFYRKKIDT